MKNFIFRVVVGLIVMFLSFFFCLAVLVTKKGTKKNTRAKRGLAALYAWDDETYRRVSDYCAKTEQRIVKDPTYMVSRRRRVVLANDMGEIMKLYRVFSV